MDSGLETAILAALPADMDHRITFSTLMDRMRLAAGAAVSYSEISDLVDDLVTAGRVACWEFEDDGWKTYSLPQPAELEPRATDIVDWQARALAAEAEVARLRMAIGAGLDEAARPASVLAESGASRVADALRSNLTPADLATRLLAAYPDVWARGMRVIAYDEQATEEGPQTGTVVRITERGDVEVCWDGFEFGERPGPTLLPTDDPEWGTSALYALPDLSDPATAGVLVGRLQRAGANPKARWNERDGGLGFWSVVTLGRDRRWSVVSAPTLGHAAALALLALRGPG